MTQELYKTRTQIVSVTFTLYGDRSPANSVSTSCTARWGHEPRKAQTSARLDRSLARTLHVPDVLYETQACKPSGYGTGRTHTQCGLLANIVTVFSEVELKETEHNTTSGIRFACTEDTVNIHYNFNKMGNAAVHSNGLQVSANVSLAVRHTSWVSIFIHQLLHTDRHASSFSPPAADLYCMLN